MAEEASNGVPVSSTTAEFFPPCDEWTLLVTLSGVHTNRPGSFMAAALIFVPVKFCIGSPLLLVNKDWGPESYSAVTHDSGCHMGHVVCFPSIDTQ